MNLNLFLKELRFHRNQLILWISVILALLILGMAFYPVLTEGGMMNQLSVLMDQPVFKTMLSVFNSDIERMSSLSGFYVTYVSIYSTLIGALFAVLTASAILAKEEYNKSAEFLLTRPISRFEVFGSKGLLIFTIILVFNTAMTLGGLAGLELFKNDAGRIVRIEAQAREELTAAFKARPAEFRDFFGLNEQKYLEFTMGQLGKEMKKNPAALKQQNFDPGLMQSMLQEVAAGPQKFLEKVKSAPEEYMAMFNFSGSTEDFLAEISKSERELTAFTGSLKSHPVKYVEIFEKDPERLLAPLKNSPDKIKDLAAIFQLDSEIEKKIFIYYDAGSFFTLALYIFLMTLSMGAVGLFISLLSKRGKPVTGGMVGFAFGCYFFDAVSRITPAADFIGYISPFKFVNTDILNPAYGLQWWRVLYFVLVTAVFTFGAWKIFERKDIYV